MSKVKLINNWIELAKVPDSDTHTLDIVPEEGNGWIVSKKTGYKEEYLSTHTFYGMTHAHSTKKLQKCGFNVQLANWDAH